MENPDVRVNLGKFAEMCRELKANHAESPYGFDADIIKFYAQSSADKPFPWHSRHQKFFDYVAKEIVMHNNPNFDDAVLLLSETPKCHSA